MAENALYAGPAMRRLRKKLGLTQAAMAGRLSISSSYLNLIERNRRPLSARVVVKVVDEFDYDPRALRENANIGGVDGLMRRFADERFDEFAIDREEIAEFLNAAPQAAAAFAKIYDQTGTENHNDDGPMVLSRQEIERWRNHFADLDNAAEELADELRLSRADIGIALTERLRSQHQISISILPVDVMPDSLRRLDLHARQLQLSEMLSPQSRNFQVALQIARLEQQESISNLAAAARFHDSEAGRSSEAVKSRKNASRALLERHLTAYFAAALIMPYGRFLRACESTNYDLPVLARRFGVSFEQLAHRLTTLQRVGQRGLPFFMCRIDRAGQFSKRFSGASASPLTEGEMSCPLWIASKSFESPGELLCQTVEIHQSKTGTEKWFTMAQTVEGSGAASAARFAVVLGLEERFAQDLAQFHATKINASRARNVESRIIGLGCARCHVPHCLQRSLPPRSSSLQFDRMITGLTPFNFGTPEE